MHGLEAALERGDLDLASIDTAVERVLRQKFELGLFDEDLAAGSPPQTLHRPEDAATARKVADQSLVLLKNDGVLPLQPGACQLAVIGPNAVDQMALFGNYNFPTNVFARFEQSQVPHFASTVLEEIERRFGAQQVRATPGCRILNGRFRRVRHPETGPEPDRDVQVISTDTTGIGAAVELARASDVVVLVLGDRAGHFQTGTVGEGTDVDDIALTGVQRELARAVLDTGTPTVVVLLNGRPLALGELADRAAAILVAWFPGEQGAGAIAAALAGDLNPGGKTPVTFSRSAGAQPIYYNHRILSHGLPLLEHVQPVFPFGHGLSYTRFALSDLQLAASEVAVDAVLELQCTLRNVGERAGDEVVQLYSVDEHASSVRPVQELKGFLRVSLGAGCAARVRFALPVHMLALADGDGRRMVEPGMFELRVGHSSQDQPLRSRVRVTGRPTYVDRSDRLMCEADAASIA